MASANELSSFSSSFFFNLLLIYTFDICIRQPLWLVTIRTSLKTKLPCVASRGSLEDRSRATWEFLRPRGVLLHTLITAQIAFLPCFSWQREMPSRLLLFWILHTQRLPIHSGNSASVLRTCVCHVHAHTRVLVQLTSKVCSRQVERCPGFSVVTELPSLCFPPIVLCGIFTACSWRLSC